MNSVYGDSHQTKWVMFDLVVRAAWSFHLSRRYNPAFGELKYRLGVQIELARLRLVCLLESVCQSL